MLKIILSLSLIPIIISVFLKALFYRKSAALEGKKAQLTTEKLIKNLLPEVEIHPSQKKKAEVKDGQLLLPPEHGESKDLSLQLETLETVGLIMLGKGKDRAVKQHASLLLFDTLFPVFSLIIVVFGCLARSIPMNLAVLLIVGSLGLTALNNLYLTWLRYQAFQLLKVKLNNIPLYMKSQDADHLDKELASRPYKYALPRIISRIL